MKLPNSLESRYVDTPNGKMHYIVSRKRREQHAPVVLVHGVGLSHRYMIPTAELLADEFTVYAPDLPGFGKSVKPWRVWTIAQLADGLAGWMGALGLENASLLGNSVGCQVIVDLAVQHPSCVGRAVLQGPTVDPSGRSFRQQFQRWRENRNLEGREKKGPIVVRDYWECGPRRLIRTFGHAIAERPEEKLPRMRCPTLVVRGHRDPIVTQPWAERVAELLPHGRLVMLPDVSHTANFEAPEALVGAVRGFLRG